MKNSPDRKLDKNHLRLHLDPSYEEWTWRFPDDEETYNKNIEKYPDNKFLLEYKNNQVKYKMNNFGFRTDDDFNPSDVANIFLGCSHTYGVGHHLENTWSYKLNKKLNNGKFYNLGHAGSGSTTHLRHFLGWYDYPKKVNAVFHYIPPHIQSNRYEKFKEGVPMIFGFNGEKDGYEFHGESYEKTYAWECQSGFNYLRDISTIKYFCEKNNIPYILCDIELFRPNGQKEGHRWARDCGHFSVEDQNLIYEWMLKKYEEHLDNS